VSLEEGIQGVEGMLHEDQEDIEIDIEGEWSRY